jgi:hypothetical protein
MGISTTSLYMCFYCWLEPKNLHARDICLRTTQNAE